MSVGRVDAVTAVWCDRVGGQQTGGHWGGHIIAKRSAPMNVGACCNSCELSSRWSHNVLELESFSEDQSPPLPVTIMADFLGNLASFHFCYRFREHCMHVYVPQSRFNFHNFLDGVPKQCKKLQLDCDYNYNHFGGTADTISLSSSERCSLSSKLTSIKK